MSKARTYFLDTVAKYFKHQSDSLSLFVPITIVRDRKFWESRNVTVFNTRGMDGHFSNGYNCLGENYLREDRQHKNNHKRLYLFPSLSET